MTIRLRSVTFILLVFVAIVPALVLGLTLYQQLYDFTYESIERHLDVSLKHITAELSHSHQMVTNELMLLSGQQAIQQRLDNQLRSHDFSRSIQNFVIDVPVMESLYLVTRDGDIVSAYSQNGVSLAKASNLFEFLPFSTQGAEQPAERSAQLYLADNFNLVKGSGKQHSLVYKLPVYQEGGAELKGYLIAIVPIYLLITQAEMYLEPHEKVGIFFRQQLLEGELNTQSSEQVLHSRPLLISGSAYQNTVQLEIKVGQSVQSVVMQVQNYIAPSLARSTMVIGIIIIMVMLFAHVIAKSFGQLYAFIRDFESGKPSHEFNQNKFHIQEIKDVFLLLFEMKQTIGEQLRTMNHKNKELARIDRLRADYLEEVQSLNSQLESKVEARTKALEFSMADLARSNFFFQQLLQFRRALEASSGNPQIVDDALRVLAACFPNTGMVLHLPTARNHESVTDSVALPKVHFEVLQQQAEQVLLEDAEPKRIEYEQQKVNLFAISCGAEKMGWLLVNEPHLSEQYYNRLLLFIVELSSFLENRSLHDELDSIARTDSLTGLSNRKAFDELQFALETQLDAEVGLFVIDVNGLKEMNDHKGHEKGDLLIISVARVLRECCEGITENYFRIGGDEFAVVLSGQQLSMAEVLRERLRSKQNHRVFINLDCLGGDPLVSFSLGYAATDEVEFSGLYRLADQNMYHDKQSYYQKRRQSEL